MPDRLLEARSHNPSGGSGAYFLFSAVCRHNATLSRPRLVTIGVLLLGIPAVAGTPPLAGLAGLVLVLGVLIVVETRRYAALREGAHRHPG